ncbi:cardiolipin synthase ClsB [Ramlibacter tataouinensis]|uniref:Cardiolipin synthase B n=1 Tax=Ramlibacter tataouinensis (strain ATCC BAA-407 / DSM 14655 / LMG 21543 / TTB310) TaxID=365046 RepID=F5Y2C8_RAMTT|nr:cardiolipin synthase ClsB [Ramlibacter tataouinensis]AEG91102.1 CL synthase [Ramlibacter tataouinensis TTB310]
MKRSFYSPGPGGTDTTRPPGPSARAPSSRWIEGNSFRLLENGEEFFPRVFECIANAKREVVLETFILFEDKVGLQLQQALLAAARNGAQVDVTVDGWGSPDLSDRFISTLVAAGVRLHVFDPGPRPFGLRPKLLRRMHRKIVVVDGEIAFVGGINYSADHLADYGPEAKQDYSVEIHGPLVAEIHRFTHAALAQGLRHERRRQWWRRRKHVRHAPEALPHAGTARAMLVTRDNVNHKDDIERQYRIAIRSARQRVVIANAYFFPGYRLVRELRRAARRGVDVRLILQGQPDMAIVKTAASTLYHHLLKAGVRVFEYCERPLHGKVALADDEWSTVGSSNLDPLSLALNLEANVIIRDREFNQHLHGRLEHLMRHSCREIDRESLGEVRGLELVRSYIAFHVMRKFPSWAQWLPRHAPRLKSALDSPLEPVPAKDHP